MEFLGEFIVGIIGEVIVNVILYALYYLLQRMGTIVRWLFFFGNRNPKRLLVQKELNTFVAVLVFAICIGVGQLINYY